MSNKSGYKQQQHLSLIQFLSEAQVFVIALVSAILSRTMLVFVDLLDCFGNLLRTAIVTVLSKKLTKDLRYEYNYGIGKVEAIASLLCDGLLFFGLLVTLGLSVYSLFFPEQPRDLIIAVVGVKVVNVSIDTVFFIKQRKIVQTHHSAISEANYAAALSALLFDSITLVSLFAMWLLRGNPIGGYISPVVSIFVVIYLMCGCIRRTRQALVELTDKTLPEEIQMKILNILVRFFDSYAQIYAIHSHKTGDMMHIDLFLGFENDTSYEEILNLNRQMQDAFDNQIGNCSVNIVVGKD